MVSSPVFQQFRIGDGEFSPTVAESASRLHAVCFPAAEVWSPKSFCEIMDGAGCGDLLLVPADPAGQAGQAEGGVNAAQALLLIRILADEAEILTLACHPALRRCGVARHLLRVGEGRALAYGAREIFLEVAEDNVSALALYYSSGFVKVGHRPHYYAAGRDGLILRKSLCAST